VVVQISPQPAKKPPGAAASVGGGASAPGAKIVYRKAAGKSWEDATLAEWPENDFRIFVGDIGNEVNDEILKSAFSKYPSFQRSKVVRDPKSLKTKGYGFVSFSDARDYVKALREMNGKYIGNRPVKVRSAAAASSSSPRALTAHAIVVCRSFVVVVVVIVAAQVNVEAVHRRREGSVCAAEAAAAAAEWQGQRKGPAGAEEAEGLIVIGPSSSSSCQLIVYIQHLVLEWW
jgi:hypothetical protein